MKTCKRLFIIFCCTMILSSNLFMFYTTPIFASEGVYDPDTSWWEKFIEESSAYIAYLACRMGAIVKDYDFAKWVQTREDYKEWWNTGHISRLESSNGEVNYSFDKELMAYIKQCLDEYMKTEQTKEENGGFYLLPTTDFSTVPASYFINAKQFRTFRNIVLEKGCLAVMPQYRSLPMRFVDPFSDPDHPVLLVANLSDLNLFEEYPYMPVSSYFFCADDWVYHDYRVQTFPDETEIYTSCSDGIDYETASNPSRIINCALTNFDVENHGSISEQCFVLYSTTGERVRVFVSRNAAQNYSVGNRKVYFTENYYNYVPEDLTVSIDDLQETVDDLQKVIDELLKQIGDDTSEKEIEDLLRQILEELKNQQGGGGGSGGGGGDMNVDIDLSTTNSWLSKIYTKVSQISDKLSGGSFLQEGFDAILSKLEELSVMLKKYLSEITGDLDDIKGQLETISEQEFNERSDSFLGEIMDALSEISEVVKTKFPFSIPNDLRIFLSKIAPAAPETEEQQIGSYSLDSSGMTLYSGEHGGGGTSDGETNPPGGGGASRPGSGFVDVDHGGGGGSRDPVEMREAPVFRLPIVIERYGIEEYIIIDMSPFDPLSRFSRGFFTIIFMVCLFNLTFKVIGMWGDLIG